MKVVEVKIIDPTGLHARPAKKIANEASKYSSDITFNCNGNVGNAKSVISLMAAFLAVKASNKVEIVAKGLDEEDAIEGIKKVMKEEKLI